MEERRRNRKISMVSFRSSTRRLASRFTIAGTSRSRPTGVQRRRATGLRTVVKVAAAKNDLRTRDGDEGGRGRVAGDAKANGTGGGATTTRAADGRTNDRRDVDVGDGETKGGSVGTHRHRPVARTVTGGRTACYPVRGGEGIVDVEMEAECDVGDGIEGMRRCCCAAGIGEGERYEL